MDTTVKKALGGAIVLALAIVNIFCFYMWSNMDSLRLLYG